MTIARRQRHHNLLRCATAVAAAAAAAAAAAIGIGVGAGAGATWTVGAAEVAGTALRAHDAA